MGQSFMASGFASWAKAVDTKSNSMAKRIMAVLSFSDGLQSRLFCSPPASAATSPYLLAQCVSSHFARPSPAFACNFGFGAARVSAFQANPTSVQRDAERDDRECRRYRESGEFPKVLVTKTLAGATAAQAVLVRWPRRGTGDNHSGFAATRAECRVFHNGEVCRH